MLVSGHTLWPAALLPAGFRISGVPETLRTANYAPSYEASPHCAPALGRPGQASGREAAAPQAAVPEAACVRPARVKPRRISTIASMLNTMSCTTHDCPGSPTDEHGFSLTGSMQKPTAFFGY